MKEDRHDRGAESYAKDFRLGVMKLAAGRGMLTLRALKVAGASVADVRYMILTRVA